MNQLEKKKQLAAELDRLANVIDALNVENTCLRDVIDILVEEVCANPDVQHCWFDKRNYSVHIVWKKEEPADDKKEQGDEADAAKAQA